MKYTCCQTLSVMTRAMPLLALAHFTHAANPPAELVVAKNQTYRVSTSQLQLKRLELQDGAVITFAPGLTRALIHADHAIIGKGVHIDASGRVLRRSVIDLDRQGPPEAQPAFPVKGAAPTIG